MAAGLIESQQSLSASVRLEPDPISVQAGPEAEHPSARSEENRMTGSDDPELPLGIDRSATNAIRTALGVAGLVSLAVGVAILVWPGRTATVVAAIIAAYAAIAGLVNLAIGVFTRAMGGWRRFGYLALGVVFLVAAIVALANLGTAAAGLATLVGVLVGVVWIAEGIVGLALIADAASKVWTVLLSSLSIVAGIAVLTSPLWGAALLWVLLGISLVVLGIVQIVRALRFGAR
jgi:uncharacterized membrane protein HdeD (DUF308 family)